MDAVNFSNILLMVRFASFQSFDSTQGRCVLFVSVILLRVSIPHVPMSLCHAFLKCGVIRHPPLEHAGHSAYDQPVPVDVLLRQRVLVKVYIIHTETKDVTEQFLTLLLNHRNLRRCKNHTDT